MRKYIDPLSQFTNGDIMQIKNCCVITYAHLDLTKSYADETDTSNGIQIFLGTNFSFILFTKIVYIHGIHVRPTIISIVTNITNERADTMSHNTNKLCYVHKTNFSTLPHKHLLNGTMVNIHNLISSVLTQLCC